MSSLFNRLFRPFTSGTMRFSPEANGVSNELTLSGNEQFCTVAAGCFWGVEHIYVKNFPELKDKKTEVGYTGGHVSSPSYATVCGKKSGHAEALRIKFDPTRTSYRSLIEFFYRIHEPTTLNRQGNDAGPQYRSAIFVHNEEQEKIAKHVTELVQKQWLPKTKIVTEIVPAGEWWKAEEDHQLYLEKTPYGYQCENHYVRKFPPLSE